MKAIKLTPKQREVFVKLTKNPDGKLRAHIKRSGTMCYRLLDSKLNPLLNVSKGVIDKLKSIQVIEKKGHDFILCATVED